MNLRYSQSTVVMNWRIEVAVANEIVGWTVAVPDGWRGDHAYLSHKEPVSQKIMNEVCEEVNEAFRMRGMEFRVGNNMGEYIPGWERRRSLNYDEGPSS